MKHSRITTLLLCTLSLGMLALSQPGDAHAEPGPPGTRDGSPERDGSRGRLGLELKIDAEALRVRLERSIAHSEEMLERNRAALEKLDAGASAPEVLNELRANSANRGPRITGRGGDHEPTPPPGNREEELRDREAMIKFLQAEFPKFWEKLEPISTEDPRNADRLLGRIAPQIMEILYLENSQPVLAKLKTQQMHAGLDFIDAQGEYLRVLSDPENGESQLADAREQLSNLAGQRFDVELLAKQYEINRLESRLSELKASIKQVEAHRDQEIAQMVEVAIRNAKRQLQMVQRRRQQSSGDD
ncbi:MAG: hypothetical protein ACF8MF_04265 [Phycisphaerales bacterium JB052]